MMTRCLLLFCFCVVAKAQTLTGWFSDEGCAKGRVASGAISPTNPDCAKKCIVEKGQRVVFISEQGKEMLYVKDYAAASAVEHLGYRVEIIGTVDASQKTVSIATVKRIGEYQGPSCARPKKTQNK